MHAAAQAGDGLAGDVTQPIRGLQRRLRAPVLG